MNKNGKYTHKLAVSGVICGDKARKLKSTLPYYTGKEGRSQEEKGKMWWYYKVEREGFTVPYT